MESIKNIIIGMFSYSKTEWSIGGVIGTIGGILSAMVGGFGQTGSIRKQEQ